jgi:hypothetical protein
MLLELKTLKESISSLESDFIYLKATVDKAHQDLTNNKKRKAETDKQTRSIKEASGLVAAAAKMTQDQIKEDVETLGTMAMTMVFDKPYEFKLLFEEVGGTLRCRAAMFDGDREMDDPEFDVGGSRIDTVSISLRAVIWSLQEDTYRPVFILDEPFTSLGSGALLERTMTMMRELVDQLGIQLIIITHIDAIADCADRAWKVVNDGVRAKLLLLTEPDEEVERIRVR